MLGAGRAGHLHHAGREVRHKDAEQDAQEPRLYRRVLPGDIAVDDGMPALVDQGTFDEV